MEDEFKSISVLMSERLTDYTSHSERTWSKTDNYEKDEGDWSSTEGSVDVVCVCMWT